METCNGTGRQSTKPGVSACPAIRPSWEIGTAAGNRKSEFSGMAHGSWITAICGGTERTSITLASSGFRAMYPLQADGRDLCSKGPDSSIGAETYAKDQAC